MILDSTFSEKLTIHGALKGESIISSFALWRHLLNINCEGAIVGNERPVHIWDSMSHDPHVPALVHPVPVFARRMISVFVIYCMVSIAGV